MQELQQLVKSLSKSEINFIKHYYRFNPEKKRLQLFTWVLNEKVSTDEEAAEKLYGKKGAAYSHLKGRLKKDILNLLLFEEGEKHSDSERFQNEVNALRSVLIGKILLVRKVQDLGVKVLKKAVEISNDNELLIENVLASDILSVRLGSKEGIEKFTEIMTPAYRHLDTLKLLLLAKKLYYEIALPNKFLKNREREYTKKAQMAMFELKTIYENNTSPSIGYYYYLTSLVYYGLSKNNEMLYELSKEFLILVQNSDLIRSRARLVNAHLQVYAASMNINNYKEALNNVNEAVKYINTGGPNELATYEYMFLALINFDYKNEELELLIKKSSVMYNNIKSIYNRGKWILYKSVYFFKVTDFENALQELQKENALLKDKSGWLFGHKLLEIMCYMELEEFDMIEFRVEALRKLLQRQKDKNITRIKTVFNVLSTFTKTGASYKKTYQKEAANFVLLREAKEEYFWDPLGYEIIRFDTWFQSKLV